MFKLKPGNVIQKLNTMNKKQAYTLGAIVVVFFVALVTLASFMGKADDASFDGLSTRGYDLAQMPFLNDEAEAYLLASKYPDMQENGSTLLYSAEEKSARQEEDAAQEAETSAEGADGAGASSGTYAGGGSGGYTYRGGRGGRGGSGGGPTQIGQLGSASMGRASGSGVSGSWGAPRGDFSPYKSQDKGSEIPAQLKNTDARKALSQFAQASRAAAGLRDNKLANAKRALMGGNIEGSEAFKEDGIDLSKASGLALDTNAPVTSPSLDNLQDKVEDAVNKEKKKEEEKKGFWEQLGERFLNAMVDGLTTAMTNGLTNLMNYGVDQLQAKMAGNAASREARNELVKNSKNMTMGEFLGVSCNPTQGPCVSIPLTGTGKSVSPTDLSQPVGTFFKERGINFNKWVKSNAGSVSVTDSNQLYLGVGGSKQPSGSLTPVSKVMQNASNAASAESLGRSADYHASQAAVRAAQENKKAAEAKKAAAEAKNKNDNNKD